MIRTFLCTFIVLAASILPAKADDTQTALFAGGCFWSMEKAFHDRDGVSDVMSGYSGGKEVNPTYEQVSSGTTGHRETVQVKFDPAKVSYHTLLEIYWRNIDPFDTKGQICDDGPQYIAAVFTADAAQKKEAEAVKAEISKKLGKPVVTDIVDAGPFYPAEAYHQDYARRNPTQYGLYRVGCGRDGALKKVWGDEAHADTMDRAAGAPKQ